MRAAARADGRDLAGHMKARSSKERKLASCQALYRAYESLSNDSAHGQDHYQQLLRAASGSLGRLAARLIPRFAHCFPAELEKSVNILTQLIKAQPAEDPGTSATLQDALCGVADTTIKLCRLSPGHAALQKTIELLLRHLQQGHDAASAESSHKVSNSAAAGLCSLFKAHARSCCLSLSQILGKPDTQLLSKACTFLHQHLLAPSFDQIPDSDPDLESCDPDKASLAQEAFEQTQLIQDVILPAQGLSGSVVHAAEWQKLLQQVVTQLVPPLADPSLSNSAKASLPASPEHASSIDMVISPPPVLLSSRLSPRRKQSPARSKGSRGSSAGRSRGSSSPRLPTFSGRVQKRTASSLRPRDTESPSSGHLQPTRRSPPLSPRGLRRPSPPPRSNPQALRSGTSLPWRASPANSGPDQGRAPLPQPGVGITAVTRCIWFGNLPPNIPEADLFTEANRVGEVQFVVLLDCSSRDEALVTFASFGGALMCWERMNGQPVFGGRLISLCFCASEPQDPRASWGHEPPLPAHVYVPDVTTVGGEAAVFRHLDVGHAPRPEHSDIIRSAGGAGLLMRFSRPAMVPDVLHALELSAQAGPSGRPGPRYMSPPCGASPVHPLSRSPSRSGRSPIRSGFDNGPPGRSPGRSGRSPGQGGFDEGPSEAGPQHPGRGPYSRLGPAPSRHEKTIWIGQLNGRVSDQELVGAFRQFGNVIDYTVIRATSCAYIDYDESHAATLARRAMNGALLGGSALRVEFKNQHSNSGPSRRDLSPRGRGRSGRMLSPRGRSRGGRPPWEQRPSPSRYGHGSSPPPTRHSPRSSRDRNPHSASTDQYFANLSLGPASQAPSPIPLPPSHHSPGRPTSHPQSALAGAVAQSMTDIGSARDEAASRMHGRDASTEGANAKSEGPSRVRARDAITQGAELVGQSGKRARTNKWDQQELDSAEVKPQQAAQANMEDKQAPQVQHMHPHISSPPPPLPLSPPPALPSAALPSAAPSASAVNPSGVHLPPHLTPPLPQSQAQHPPQHQAGVAALPSHHPGQLLNQRQPPASAHALSANSGVPSPDRTHSGSSFAWEGQLAKSGMIKCRARCLTLSRQPPLQWPAVMDVRNRCKIGQALDQAKQQASVPIRCIVSTDDVSNQQEFHEFCEYLLEKQRGGVVTLPSATRKPSEVFLVPGSPHVLQQLQVPDPGKECLLAIQKV